MAESYRQLEERVHQLRSQTIRALICECHQRSKNGGWWTYTQLEEQDINVMATKIALIHSEVSEMLEGLRKGHPDDHLPHRSTEEVEAADILIRLFDYAGARGLDLQGAIREKLDYNEVRADHKPEARAAAGGKKI